MRFFAWVELRLPEPIVSDKSCVLAPLQEVGINGSQESCQKRR